MINSEGAKNINTNTQKEEELKEERTLLSWKSPARPFKKRDKDYFTTIGAMVFLFVVILLFLKEFLLIAVILSLAFVSYVLAAVPPEEVEHRITSRGIETGKVFYPWEELGVFWFTTKWKQDVLWVQTWRRLPGYLLILLGEKSKEEVKRTLSKYIIFVEHSPKNWLDQAAEWLSQKIPLEKQP